MNHKLFLCVLSVCLSRLSATTNVTSANGSKSSSTSRETCDIQLQKAEICVNKMLLLFDPDVLSFESEDQFVKSYCEPFPVWLNCVSEYKPCLRSLERTLFSLMIRNVKKTWKRFCRSPVLIRESYRHLQCLRPETKPLVNKISDQIIGLMDYISKVGMTNAVAPLCCGTRLMLDEVEAEINGVCLNMTGLLESGKFVRSIVSSTVTDMMELMCSAYSDTRTCSQKHPTIMSDIRNVIEHPKESNHQIVTSFLSLFKKLERESQTGF